MQNPIVEEKIKEVEVCPKKQYQAPELKEYGTFFEFTGSTTPVTQAS